MSPSAEAHEASDAPRLPVSRVRVWTLRIAPWVLAVAALALILRRYPPARIAAEMQRGDTLAMLPFALVSGLVSWVVVTTGDTVVIGSCLARPRFLQVMRGVAGSAVLNAFGYLAGLGGYALWIARIGGTRVRAGVGLVAYIATSELTAVAVLATVALWTGDFATPPSLRWAASAVAALLLTLKLVRPQRWLSPFDERSLWRPWQAMSTPRAALELCVRLVQLGVLGVTCWLGARAFGLSVPLVVMLGVVPMVLLVVSLPVNVAGFGAVQGVWLLLLPWAQSGEQVLAFSVLWQLMVGALGVVRGLPFAKRTLSEAMARPEAS